MTAYDVAKYFVSLVDEDAGDSISNLKIQKLLYYAQGFHLAIFGKPLFSEAIKAWIHGPVVPQVWHRYKEYGSGPVPFKPIEVERYPFKTRKFLEEIYEVYGQFTASKLRDLTHNEPPWKNTPQNEAISQASLLEYFKTLVTGNDDNSETET